MKTVHVELLEASKAEPQRENEDDNRYRARIAREVDQMDDALWKGLSKEAQEWGNKAVEDLNKKAPVLDFPVLEEAEDDKEEVEELRKTAKTHLPGAKRKRGACRLYREIMIGDVSLKKEEIFEQLKAKGFQLSEGTGQILYYETKMTLSVLANLQDEVVLETLRKFRGDKEPTS